MTPNEYKTILCDAVASHFGGRRLWNPKARAREEMAAVRLGEAKYKLSYLRGLLGWAFVHDYWRRWVISVESLAHYLLEPEGKAEQLEADYEAHLRDLEEHPPRCAHGQLLTGFCFKCRLDPKCPICKGWGAWVEKVDGPSGPGMTAKQVICPCALATKGTL